MARKKKLPNKLSALLRLAVEDAKICARTKGYKLNMRRWHEPWPEKKICEVCMAGAVLAVELQMPWEQSYLHVSSDSDPYRQHIFAINSLRVGNTALALLELSGYARFARLGADDRLVLDGIGAQIRKNIRGGRAPWLVYLRAAKKLERMGL